MDASGKLQLLDRLLARLHANGHRVVLFSQFTSMLDLLEQYLTGRAYECAPSHPPCATERRKPRTSQPPLTHATRPRLRPVAPRVSRVRRRYCRLDGSTNRVQRTVDINAFNVAGSSRFVFVPPPAERGTVPRALL
ncbi:SWF/SNF helicase family protein [bacterium]|nr:SWF/SNF helicase family protein [bacterium]